MQGFYKGAFAVAKPLPAWKKGLGVSLTLSVAAALFVFLRSFDENTWGSLLRVKVEYLLAACGLVLVLWVLEGLRIKLLVYTLNSGKRLALWDTIQVFLLTFFFASVTPFSSGEWPAHIYALNRHGLSVGESSAVTATRALITRLIFTLTAVSLLVVFRGKLVPTFFNRIYIYAVYVSIFTALFLFFLLWKTHILDGLLQKICSLGRVKRWLEGSPAGKKAYFFLNQEFRAFLHTARSLNRFKVGNMFLIILLSVAFWLCFFSIAPIILLGLGQPVPYLQALIWQFVIQMIIVYVPLPGGSGVAELGLASLFAFFVSPSILGIFVVVWRLLTYYTLLLSGGLIALGKLKPRKVFP
jgi:uncharacterized protein (TIRG00374 family)